MKRRVKLLQAAFVVSCFLSVCLWLFKVAPMHCLAPAELDALTNFYSPRDPDIFSARDPGIDSPRLADVGANSKLMHPPPTLVPKISCVSVGVQRKCFEPASTATGNSTHIWPGFIGIGPARSGSSNLLWNLEQHPEVQVGQPEKQGQTCCQGSELYFFNKDSLFERGIEFYKGFFGARETGKKIAGEKTPSYSDHPLVPYRIRAVLGPSVKLLFTLRDPSEAVLSLYSLRGLQDRDVKIQIPEYFDKLWADQERYDTCVGRMLRRLFPDSSYNSIFALFQSGKLDIQTAMTIDEYVYGCWSRDKSTIRWHDEILQHYIFEENLIRWHTVFPEGQVMCIWSDEFRSHGREILTRIFNFLELSHLPEEHEVLGHKNGGQEKAQWKKKLGQKHALMCDFMKKRNAGIEKLCPRMYPGSWKWCKDAPELAEEKVWWWEKKGWEAELRKGGSLGRPGKLLV